MQLSLNFRKKIYSFDTSQGIDLSTPLKTEHSVSAFYLNPPTYKPFRAGGFVGSVSEGGPCNCEEIFISPHGNGTHTECVGHISAERITIRETLTRHIFICRLITLAPQPRENGDMWISHEQMVPFLTDLEDCEALIIRTLPNDDSKLVRNYSGSNPCYLDPNIGRVLAQAGLLHLILDLPSVDREEDEGKLSTHHAFWQYPENTRMDATITELAFIPSTVADGYYLLNLMIASFDSDASPSKPVIYPIFE